MGNLSYSYMSICFTHAATTCSIDSNVGFRALIGCNFEGLTPGWRRPAEGIFLDRAGLTAGEGVAKLAMDNGGVFRATFLWFRLISCGRVNGDLGRGQLAYGWPEWTGAGGSILD